MPFKATSFSFFFTILFISSMATTSLPTSVTPMTEHFILVHGESHGAWSWFKLIPLLKASGYNVTAIDLAGNGINPEQTINFKSAIEYFKPLIDLMESLPSTEKVVLVGHAFGGIAISQAMERFPSKIQCAIFVTAYMPGPTLSISAIRDEAGRREGDQLDNIAIYGNGPNNPPTASNLGPKFLKSKFYPLSPIQDWVLATTLMRPTPFFTKEDLSSQELIYTKEKYGTVKKAYIIVKDDIIIEKDLQMWMIQKNPPNLIEEISEADHMAMISKPYELSNALIKIVKNENAT